MTIERLFTLDPQNPSFDKDESDGVPGVSAFVNFWNIAALAWGGSGGTKPTLESQLEENWVYLSGNSAAPFDEDSDGLIQNRERSPIIEIGVQCANVDGQNKILFKIELHALGDNAVVRIAVDRKIVQTEHLRKGDNSISVMVNCPYDRAWIYLDIKHVKAENGKASAFGFKSVTGYLL